MDKRRFDTKEILVGEVNIVSDEATLTAPALTSDNKRENITYRTLFYLSLIEPLWIKNINVYFT